MNRRSLARLGLWMLLGALLPGVVPMAAAQEAPQKQPARPGSLVRVPDVVGMKEPQARATLSRAGLRMRRGTNRYTDVPSRNLTVAEQVPAAGESVRRGRVVVVILYVYKPPSGQVGH
jgi:hypothetical protein